MLGCGVIVLGSMGCRQRDTMPVWSAEKDLSVAGDFDPPVDVALKWQHEQVKDCDSAVTLIRRGFEPANAADYGALRAAALRCVVGKVVDKAQPAARSYWSDREAETTARALTEKPGWEVKPAIVAKGDFDGDGAEDRLVRIETYATQGTGRDIRYLLLTKADKGTPAKLLHEIKL